MYKKKNKELLFKIIKSAFAQRRKTLENALINGKIVTSKERIQEIFDKLGIEKNVRGEKLSLEQYESLCKIIVKSL